MKNKVLGFVCFIVMCVGAGGTLAQGPNSCDQVTFITACNNLPFGLGNILCNPAVCRCENGLITCGTSGGSQPPIDFDCNRADPTCPAGKQCCFRQNFCLDANPLTFCTSCECQGLSGQAVLDCVQRICGIGGMPGNTTNLESNSFNNGICSEQSIISDQE